MFTQEELKMLSSFLNRADIKGGEAITLINLQQKIAKIYSEAQKASVKNGADVEPKGD